MKYNEKIKELKKTFEEIKRICNKYYVTTDDINEDLRVMASKASIHLMLIDWYEKYGLEIDHSKINSDDINFIRINDYCFFSKEETSSFSIGCTGKRKKLNDGWYLVFNLSETDCILRSFGNDELLKDFFNEIINKYKPDSLMNFNSNMYWKIENSKNIFDNFDKLLNKYRKIKESKRNKSRIESLEKELKSLKEEL